jgi:hypothetical protein
MLEYRNVKKTQISLVSSEISLKALLKPEMMGRMTSQFFLLYFATSIVLIIFSIKRGLIRQRSYNLKNLSSFRYYKTFHKLIFEFIFLFIKNMLIRVQSYEHICKSCILFDQFQDKEIAGK